MGVREDTDYDARAGYTHEELVAMDLAEEEARRCGQDDLVNSDVELPGHEP